ncbi:MAG: hypothetical protein IT236_19395, partial [Bacteroidia bacterium]|nr:hypothetical protein [Bacteroidia bacterium]
MATKLLKNSSLQGKPGIFIIKNIKRLLAFYVLFQTINYNAQIANYVTNGGFEDYYDCNGGNINKLIGWRTIDSSSSGTLPLYNVCNNNVPFDGYNYQKPFVGKGFGAATFFCPPPYCSFIGNRTYFRNRLKANLKQNKTYCVKLYYNVRDRSSYGIDAFGISFIDNSIDTITKGWIPLTFLNPQIQNVSGNYAIDTLNWHLLSGTFVATGNEKNILIGNFKSDAATGTVLINPTSLPNVGLDMYIDHVSCIDVDLPAFAGTDKHIIPGETLYLGRARDVGIDEACMWYK